MPALAALIVEDRREDFELITHRLRKAYDPLTAELVDTEELMRHTLRQRPWDVILCDYVLPLLELQAALRVAREEARYTPLVVVSGHSDEWGLQAIRAGADDYILKNKLDRLPFAIDREIIRARALREHGTAARTLIASLEKK